MRPKGKLFALFAVFAAIGLVTASGAFTTVQADRTAEVSAAGDGSALLQLTNGTGVSDSSNADDYVDQSNGQIEILLDGSGDVDDTGDAGGSGVNLNARTTVNGLINVTNQGSQEVQLYITTDESELGNTNSRVVTFHAGQDPAYDTNSNITGSGNPKTLGTGDTITLSMEIDTRGEGDISGQDIVDDITIVANESVS